MKFVGTVGKILDRNVKTRKGAVTFYSVKLDEHEEWISLGTKRPTTFEEGDKIAIEAEQNAKGYWDAVSIEAAQAPAPAKASASSGTPSPSVERDRATASGAVRSGAGSQAGSVDRQTAITLQHSQEMALRAVSILLTHDGLPLTKASTKAGQAKRFEEIVAAIDKLTVKYHKDVETGRLFEAVADMGVVDTSADGPIPEQTSTTSTDEDDV